MGRDSEQTPFLPQSAEGPSEHDELNEINLLWIRIADDAYWSKICRGSVLDLRFRMQRKRIGVYNLLGVWIVGMRIDWMELTICLEV